MMAGLGLLVVAASIYLVYVLEILKFRRLDAMRLRRLRPEASPAEIESGVARDLETGEFHAVSTRRTAARGRWTMCARRAEHGVGERQVDEDRVGAEQERGATQAPITADGR